MRRNVRAGVVLMTSIELVEVAIDGESLGKRREQCDGGGIGIKKKESDQ